MNDRGGYCCLCFEWITVETCARDEDGGRWNACRECWAFEHMTAQTWPS